MRLDDSQSQVEATNTSSPDLTKQLLEAKLEALKDLQTEWYVSPNGTLAAKPDSSEDWLGASLYERIAELEAQLNLNQEKS